MRQLNNLNSNIKNFHALVSIGGRLLSQTYTFSIWQLQNFARFLRDEIDDAWFFAHMIYDLLDNSINLTVALGPARENFFISTREGYIIC